MFTLRFHFLHHLPEIQKWFGELRASVEKQSSIPFADFTMILPLPSAEQSKTVLAARGAFEVHKARLTSKSEDSAEAEFPVPENGSIWIEYSPTVELNCAELDLTGCRLTDIRGITIRFCRDEVFPGIPKRLSVAEIRYVESTEVQFICVQGDTPELTLIADFR